MHCCFNPQYVIAMCFPVLRALQTHLKRGLVKLMLQSKHSCTVLQVLCVPWTLCAFTTSRSYRVKAFGTTLTVPTLLGNETNRTGKAHVMVTYWQSVRGAQE